MCEEDLRLKGKKKLKGKGISVSTGAPLGTGVSAGRPLGMRAGCLGSVGVAPWPSAPAFGERGGWGCWGLVSFGGQIRRVTGSFRSEASGCLRGLAFRVSEGQLAPQLLSVAPFPGKHIPAGGCVGIPVGYKIRR